MCFSVQIIRAKRQNQTADWPRKRDNFICYVKADFLELLHCEQTHKQITILFDKGNTNHIKLILKYVLNWLFYMSNLLWIKNKLSLSDHYFVKGDAPKTSSLLSWKLWGGQDLHHRQTALSNLFHKFIFLCFCHKFMSQPVWIVLIHFDRHLQVVYLLHIRFAKTLTSTRASVQQSSHMITSCAIKYHWMNRNISLKIRWILRWKTCHFTADFVNHTSKPLPSNESMFYQEIWEW